MKKLIAACTFAALLGAAPAIAADTTNDNRPPSDTSSGPGVKGAPGSTNGPAMDANDPASNSGASSGDQACHLLRTRPASRAHKTARMALPTKSPAIRLSKTDLKAPASGAFFHWPMGAGPVLLRSNP